MQLFKKIILLNLLICILSPSIAYASDLNQERALYESYIVDICGDYPIDPNILIALVEKESCFKSNAVSENGKHKGLTQLTPKLFKDRMDELGLEDSVDPYSNLMLCADYIYSKVSEGNDIELVLMMWNMGEDKAKASYSKGHVSSYAKHIMKRASELGGDTDGSKEE